MKQGIPALIVVLAVAVAAVVVDQTSSERTVPSVAVHAVDGPVVPPARAASVAWYCAEGTSSLDGRADETVVVANLAKEPIRAAVTVMPGGGAPTKSFAFQVDALAQRRVKVSNVLATPEPGVVVEVFGGPAVVEHEVRGRDDVAVGPCAREPAKRWYFAAGDTARGGEQWLALFNPFSDDAIVDVTFVTDSGVREPAAAQHFVVPSQSRVSMPVHDLARRQERVAVEIRATTGRIVAERSLRYDGSEGIAGIAVSLGVTGLARGWTLPFGDAGEGSSQTLAVANFGSSTSTVEVATPLDDTTTIEPQTLDVPAHSVVAVDTDERAPVDVGYAVTVRVVRGPPVAAEMFGSWVAPAETKGVATSPGTTEGATRWAFATGRLSEQGDAVLSALNVSGRPITVQLYAYTAGDPNSPTSAPAEAVAPGERATFRLRERDIEPDQVIVVAADGPIVAGRQIESGGVSLALGVPERS